MKLSWSWLFSLLLLALTSSGSSVSAADTVPRPTWPRSKMRRRPRRVSKGSRTVACSSSLWPTVTFLRRLPGAWRPCGFWVRRRGRSRRSTVMTPRSLRSSHSRVLMPFVSSIPVTPRLMMPNIPLSSAITSPEFNSPSETLRLTPHLAPKWRTKHCLAPICLVCRGGPPYSVGSTTTSFVGKLSGMGVVHLPVASHSTERIKTVLKPTQSSGSVLPTCPIRFVRHLPLP